jgi:predicted nucleic acid-binding protein
MRKYLLDSTPMAAFLNNREAAISLIGPWIKAHEVATSILVYGEVVEYIKGFSNFEERHSQLRRLLREVYPYFLTYPILERYADIRRELRPPKGPGIIGDIDTLIAATALDRGLTVVTTDEDFKRVTSLEVLMIERDALKRSRP